MQRTQGQTIGDWLDGVGLGEYTARFTAADVDLEVLPHLTDSDLKELGVGSLGHRRKIMHALKQPVEPRGDVQVAEKRFITVLFCDIVGSTALSQTLDAETFSEILGRFHTRVAQTAETFGGHVAQFLGDGALIYFGSPTPLEDAAASAAFTALRLPSDVRDVAGADGPPIDVRIGISSGLVVVDAQLSGDWLAVGQTVHLASRLQAEAAPGEVVISNTTAALLRRQFDVTHIATKPLKGIAEPSALYRLGGELFLTPGGGARQQGAQPKFVNRVKELEQVNAQWEIAKSGGNAAMLITGEAGIGKSRLIAEILDGWARDNAHIKRYACSPIGTSVPFFAFIRPLQQAIADGDADATSVLGHLEATSFASQQERRDNRRSSLQELTAYLNRTEAAEPYVLLIEDIQWADPSTREVLADLQRSDTAHRLLLLTSRDADEVDHLHPDAQAVHIDLKPLSFQHTCDIIRDWLNAVAGWEDLITPLAKRADGIPIFAEELANEMRLRKDIGAEQDAVSIPFSLQQSLQARIHRLQVGRPLLRLASSLARVSPIHILRELWDFEASFDAAVAELEQSGLAHLIAGGPHDPDGLLEIKHQMVRECAYDMILARDRIRIHTAIVTVLEGPAGSNLNAALIAEQVERSGQHRRAAERWVDAGRLAAAQSADAEAVTLYRRALALVPLIPDKDWALTFEIETTLALYPVQIGAEGYNAARHDLAELLDRLVDQHEDADQIMTGMFYQWLHLLAQGDIALSYDLVESIPPIAGSQSGEVLQMLRDRMAGSTLMFLGDFHEARVCLERMVATYNADTHAPALLKFGATDNYVTVLCCLAAIEALDGTAATTHAAIDRALGAAEEGGHVHTMCHSLTFGVGLPAIIVQDWDRLLLAATRLAELATARDLLLWRHFGAVLQGILMVAEGDHSNGDKTYDMGQAGLHEQGFHFMTPTFDTLREAARAMTQQPDARVLADLERKLNTGERWLLPLCRSLKASQ